MKAKTAIGIAVASALSWSYGAWANNEYVDTTASSSFGAIAPYSPNESGPAPWPGQRDLAMEAGDAGSMAVHEIETPLASNEAGMSEAFAAREPVRIDVAQASMPNPQTPWTQNEAGFDSHAEGVQAYERQRAEIEQARVAAAEWNGQLASVQDAPIGSTAERVYSGSSGFDSSAASPHALQGSGNEAGMPSEAARASAMRQEPADGLPADATVGVLEVPARVTEYTVWSVEPLTPDADLTRGDTVYLAPEGSEPVLILGSSGGEASEGAAGSAAIADSESSGEASGPSL